jgi:hypothetical protein
MKCILPLIISLLWLQVKAQSYLDFRSKHPLFDINIEFGVSNPILQGGSSLDLSSIPENKAASSIVSESKILNESIESGWLLAVEGTYTIRPKVYIGLSAQYRRMYEQNSSMVFNQELIDSPQNLTVTSFGEFSQKSSIQNLAIMATSKISLITLDFFKHNTALLEVGFGGGASIYNITSSVSNAFLKLKVYNDFVDAIYILGPGYKLPESDISTSLAWQFSTNIRFDYCHFPIAAVGFRICDLGKFVIMKRPSDSNSLFSIKAVNYQDQNYEAQELSIFSTNYKREIISKELFLKVYY